MPRNRIRDDNGRFKSIHGLSKKRIYNTWYDMWARCNNPSAKSFNHYGGRGIHICEEWNTSFLAFYNWAIANGYNDSLFIDRIDNDGNYEPSNCRWVTRQDNCNNKRNNHHLLVAGEYLTIAELSRKYDINQTTIRMRAKRGVTGLDLVKQGRVI